MEYGQALWIYLALVFGIIVVPGMDMFFVLANALTGGWRLGLAAVAGIMLGGAVHTLIGSLIVGAITRLPETVFQLMILVGAGYMAWIGWTLLRSTITVGSIDGVRPRPGQAAFTQGLVTCLLNPKAFLFVLAVFPQFMRSEFGPMWTQGLALGALTVATQGIVYGTLALAAGRGRDALTGHPQVTIWIGRAAGALFAVAAVFTALHAVSGHAVS